MAEKITHIRPVDSGGEPPDMEQRLRHLEQDMASLKTSVGHIQETMATKADMSDLRAEVHSLLRQNIMWSVGTILATGTLVFTIMRITGA